MTPLGIKPATFQLVVQHVNVKWKFQYTSNKIRYAVYLYLETALHVSGGICTHHKEHTQLYLQHLVLVKPLTATCR